MFTLQRYFGKCFGLTTCARCKGRHSPFLEASGALAGCVVRENVHVPGGIQGNLLVGALPWVKLCGSCHFTSCCGLLSSGPLGCLWGPSTLAWAALDSKARAPGLPNGKCRFRQVGYPIWAWCLQPQVAKPSWSISDSGQF